MARPRVVVVYGPRRSGRSTMARQLAAGRANAPRVVEEPGLTLDKRQWNNVLVRITRGEEFVFTVLSPPHEPRMQELRRIADASYHLAPGAPANYLAEEMMAWLAHQ